MSTQERQAIAGFGRKDDVDWGWFGSMDRAIEFKKRVNENDPNLSRALAAIGLDHRAYPGFTMAEIATPHACAGHQGLERSCCVLGLPLLRTLRTLKWAPSADAVSNLTVRRDIFRPPRRGPYLNAAAPFRRMPTERNLRFAPSEASILFDARRYTTGLSQPDRYYRFLRSRLC